MGDEDFFTKYPKSWSVEVLYSYRKPTSRVCLASLLLQKEKYFPSATLNYAGQTWTLRGIPINHYVV